MLEALIKIGKNLEKNWQREGFPSIARATLESFSVELSLEEFETQVAEWLKSKELPSQLNLYNNFGEPSLTLFNNGKFAIDIYFWRKNDTLIHSHGFRGAFKILYGLSLHEEFDVEIVERFSGGLLKTDLSPKSIRVMEPGDVQQINPDMELTHRVAHLDNPTVSLCIRTVEDRTLHQWHHLSTGLSFQKTHTSDQVIKKTLYFQYLLESDHVRAKEFFLELLNELSPASQVSLYEGLFFGELGLDAEATELAAGILYDYFQEKKWFELYEKHYVDLQENLRESQAQSPEVRLFAHGVNNRISIEKIVGLMKLISDKDTSQLCNELKSNTSIFTEGFESIQLEKIEKYIKDQQ